MPSIFEVYSKALEVGKEKDVYSNDIRALIAYDNGFSEPIDVLYNRDKEMQNLQDFSSQFARLLDGEPLEYIINQATFLHHKLYVDNNVLIPRESLLVVAN